ncbi:MAG: hypothetical protein J5836_00685 [Clostridia bacterium]|nr:hypothetical protein [Clostridia bacterium]
MRHWKKRVRIKQTLSLPSQGDVDVPVIPIGFANAYYEKYGAQDEMPGRLNDAFDGVQQVGLSVDFD